MTNTNEQTEASANTIDEKLEGISGWLILPAIGLLWGPIFCVIVLIESFNFYSEIARAGEAGLYVLVLIVTSVYIAFSIYAAILFFKMKKNAPLFIIILVITNIALSVIVYILDGLVTDITMYDSGKILVGNVIIGTIWILYFKFSKRVKATFRERRDVRRYQRFQFSTYQLIIISLTFIFKTVLWTIGIVLVASFVRAFVFRGGADALSYIPFWYILIPITGTGLGIWSANEYKELLIELADEEFDEEFDEEDEPKDKKLK